MAGRAWDRTKQRRHAVATLQVAEATASAADLEGRVLSGSVTIVAQAKPNVRDVRVHLDDADIPFAVDASAPFEVALSTTQLTDGPQVLAVHIPIGRSGAVREVARARFDVVNSRVAPQPQPAPGPAP